MPRLRLAGPWQKQPWGRAFSLFLCPRKGKKKKKKKKNSHQSGRARSQKFVQQTPGAGCLPQRERFWNFGPRNLGQSFKEFASWDKKKVGPRNLRTRFPADMKFHQALCQFGGLHDDDDAPCVRCKEIRDNARKILEVVVLETETTLTELAKTRCMFKEDLVLINSGEASATLVALIDGDTSNLTKLTARTNEIPAGSCLLAIKLFPMDREGPYPPIFFTPCGTHGVMRLSEGSCFIPYSILLLRWRADQYFQVWLAFRLTNSGMKEKLKPWTRGWKKPR